MSLKTIIVALFALTCLSIQAYASSGTASYYTPPYTPSACYGYQDEGVMIAAASDALWNNGGACGQMLQVTCTGATNEGVPQPCRGDNPAVTVKIVDHCPAGCAATIDLSQEAFAQIADPNAGVITITY